MAQDAVNVVDDFTYDSRNGAYNRSFREWRSGTRTGFAYRYSDNPRERSYVAGKALTKPSAAHVERKMLSRVCEVIGAALLLYIVCEIAGGSLLVQLFQFLGMDVHLDFLTSSAGGSQLAVAGVRTLTLLLKYSIPIIVLVACFRLPRRVILPHNFRAMPETLLAVGCAMVSSAVYTLTAQAQGVEDAQSIFTYKDTAVIAGYALADAIIGSILAELMLRGLMLPVVRQFGDSFAVWTTAACAFFFPNILPLRIGELMLGLAGGYIMLRGGSIWKCVLMRFLFTLLNLSRVILIYTQHTFPRWQFVMILLLTGVGLIFFYMRVRRKGLLLANRRTQLSGMKKLSAAMQSVTMLPWAAIALLMFLIQMFF